MDGEISCVILPHPYQNPSGTAEALASLAKSSYGNQIVLVSFASGSGRTPVTGDYSWQTPFGVISPGSSQLQDLISAGVKTDNQILGKESDLGLLMIYLQYYLQDIKVTPLLLDRDMTAAEMKEVLAPISIIGGNTTLLIVPPYVAEEKELPFSDNRDWAQVLSPGGGALTGYLEDSAIQGLTVAEALLPTDEQNIISLYYSKDEERTIECFSDLLIFYGSEN